MNSTNEGNVPGISSKSAETLDALLAHYVAGSLPVPVATMVEAHIELREASRLIVEELEAAAARELERCEPSALTNRDAMIEAIVSSHVPVTGKIATRSPSCPIFPRSLQDFVGYRATEVPWRSKLPGFREHAIGEWDGWKAELLWIRAGRAMPAHTHGGSELTLVVDGGFADMGGHYVRGDIAAADESVDHRPIADDDGPCICLAITTAPLKLTGSMTQLFSDIFGR